MSPALRSRCPRTGPELAGPLESGGLLAHVAQSAEHFLGKEEVSSSNLDVGSSASPAQLLLVALALVHHQGIFIDR